ncbi:MAG: hypothetical protein K2X69_05155 [Silvanigrellaceae bacterium]|nr:hypothetical protein [Silvanigrellaceae bacterium]
MKNKIYSKIVLFFLSIVMTSNTAQAEWSYAGKFLATTASGCAAGLASGYMVGNYGGYDSQPKQIVTYMGGVTGCLTGALFSYFFYDEPSKDLAQRNEQLQYVNDRLQLQLQSSVNANQLQKLGGMLPTSPSGNNLGQTNSILENMKIAQIDPSKIGGMGSILNGIKKCNIIYPLWMGKDGFVNSSNDKINEEDSWIPVSPNFAIKVWQFYYSKDGCFEKDPRYGYFEKVVPGLTKSLKMHMDYTLGINEDNLKKE